jgi:hypothetical protein
MRRKAGSPLLLLALACAPVFPPATPRAVAAFAPAVRPPRGLAERVCLSKPSGTVGTMFVLLRGTGDTRATVARARKLKDTDTVYLHRNATPHRSLAEEDVRKRIIIVGDVHGCFDELCDLLEKARFERGEDRLILAGDFVNKGPRSADVVRFAREVGAHAVLGNHELLSLRARATLDSSRSAEAISASKYSWTKELREEDLDFLRSLPYTIRLPWHQAVIGISSEKLVLW